MTTAKTTAELRDRITAIVGDELVGDVMVVLDGYDIGRKGVQINMTYTSPPPASGFGLSAVQEAYELGRRGRR